MLHILKTRDVRTLGEGIHSDGGGLYLRVSKTGARTWQFRYQFAKKRSTLSLGNAQYLNLVDARQFAQRLNEAIAVGRDPRAELRSIMGFDDEKEEEKPVDMGPLFADVWSSAIDDVSVVKCWRNPKSEVQWRRSIENYALPTLGSKHTKEISREDVLRVLRPIWWTKTDTAKKLVGRLATVFDWCKTKGYMEGENPAVWRGNLALSLPSPSRVYQSKPHRTIPWAQLPDLIATMWEKNTIGGIAVVFGCITASRAQEFVLAKWNEFDRARGVWSMPAERRKDGVPFDHRVPMNKYTWACLDRLSRFERRPSQKEYLFPGQAGAKTIALQTPAILIQKAAFNATMHGLRSTFLDWVADTKGTAYLHAAEKALSHAVGDKVTQSYLRTDKYEERVVLMEEFAEFCFSKVPTRIR